MPQFSAAPYDHDHENEVMLFAETNFRNSRRKFGIKTDDRRRHVYVIGKTGMGKTTLLETMVVHDIMSGHGVAYIDPHGDTAQKFLDFIPPHRINDVVYFNPADTDFPVGFNPLETTGSAQEKNLVGQGLMGVFKKIWGPEVFSARMEYIMLNTVMALLDAPGSTLLGVNRIFVDEDYRKRVVSLIQDPSVKSFWVKEFAGWDPKYRTEAVAAIANKVGQFLSSPVIRNIVAQVKSTVNLREVMDGRKILVCNLSKGMVGEENSRLLGAMLITRLQLAAMERVDIPVESDRQDFYLYVDEFQNFATESFANILSEARKYRLNLVVAHQYIEQLDETVRAAVFGNVGTIVSFRVGAADAVFMEQEFAPRFLPEDLVNLRKYEIYLKLMIDGATSQPFSAGTLPPIDRRTGSTEKVIKVSRERYATPRQKIEEKVLRWSGIETAGDADDEARNAPSSEIVAEEQAIEEQMKVLETTSPKIPELVKSAKKSNKPTFTAPCSICGKPQTLTFEPNWERPWFCKEDLEKRKAAMERGEKVPEPTINALGLPLGQPIPPDKLPASMRAALTPPAQPDGISAAPLAPPAPTQPIAPAVVAPEAPPAQRAQVPPPAPRPIIVMPQQAAAPMPMAPRPMAPQAPRPMLPRQQMRPIIKVGPEVKPVSLAAMLGKPIPKGPQEELVEDDEDELPVLPSEPRIPAKAPLPPAEPRTPPRPMAPPPVPPPIRRPPPTHLAGPRPAPPVPPPIRRELPRPPSPPASPSSGNPLQPGDVVKF